MSLQRRSAASSKDVSIPLDVVNIEFLIQQQHFDVAGQILADELERRPRSVPAHRLLTLLSLTRADNPRQTVTLATSLAALAPQVADYRWYLGLAYKAAGMLDDARRAYRVALELNVRHAAAWVSLGIVNRAQGQFDEAISCYRKALALNPGLAEVHSNLGNALADRDRQSDPLSPITVSKEMLEAQRRAYQLDPTNPGVAANLAVALEFNDELDQAVELYNQALGGDPERQDWLLRLGGCLTKQRMPAALVALYEKWMETHPESSVVASNLSLAFLETNELARALEWADKAIAFDGEFGGAHFCHASALLRACEAERAVAAYRRALALSPQHHASARSGLLMSLNYIEEDPAPLYELHSEFGEAYEGVTVRSIDKRSRHGRKLRIGYLSGDFKQHSVAWFIESVIENHDREKFDVVCYHNTYADDVVTARIRAYASQWVPCLAMTDQVLAQRIQDDEIDILIDLSGHTHGHRLSALATRPAPVQMTYLGYPTTTGLRAIDFRITDEMIDPVDGPKMNAETPLRCAHSMFCYRPGEAPDVGSAPFEKNGAITFGSFNNGAKLSDRTLALWSRVLAEVPESNLFLKTQAFSQALVRERVRERMQSHGIDPARVRFDPWRSDKASHMELYREVDIALDTYPYNGATTTCEALWMGVPVVSLAGRTHVSRMGASILHGAGFDQWVTRSVDDFVKRAVALAHDRATIAGFRASARSLLRTSPLIDGTLFTKNFEALLTEAWDARAEPQA